MRLELAARTAALFDGTDVAARPLDAGIGTASALKTAYASFQKSARVLAAVSHALAASHDAGEELAEERRALTARILAETDHFPSVAARAWRWASEMTEIAAALDAVGLPPDLAEASATVLRHWTAHGRTSGRSCRTRRPSPRRPEVTPPAAPACACTGPRP